MIAQVTAVIVPVAGVVGQVTVVIAQVTAVVAQVLMHASPACHGFKSPLRHGLFDRPCGS